MDTDQTITPPDLSKVGERVREDISMLRDAIGHQSDQIRNTTYRFVDEHPIQAVAAAFGIGYVLSGALFSRATGKMLTFGGRFLLGRIARQVFAGGGFGFAAEAMHAREPGAPPVGPSGTPGKTF